MRTETYNPANVQATAEKNPTTAPRVESRTTESEGETIRVVRLRVSAAQRSAMASAIRLGKSTSK